MRVAVDAMGGDFAPREIVAGAVQAAAELPKVSKIILVGDETAVRRELARHGPATSRIEVLHASESVGMGEAPALAIRRKKDNSISRAVDLVKSGDADAALSAGNTGAMVVAASLKLRTLDNVRRPAIATVMPTLKDPFVLIDAGANVEAEPALLAQFAAMGSVYSRILTGKERPVVGLLSVGEEDTKGNEVTRQAFELLRASRLNFRGNVEGHDLFEGGTDVVVCDGFVGNVVLKTSESAARAIARMIRIEFLRTPVRAIGAFLLRPALNELRKRMDPELYGGAPLLGVRGLCIITHGASRAKAIRHAIRVAADSVHGQLNERIVETIRENGF